MTNSPPSKRADRHGESRNQNQPLRVPQKRAWTQQTTPCHLKTSYQPSPAGPLSLFPFRDLTDRPGCQVLCAQVEAGLASHPPRSCHRDLVAQCRQRAAVRRSGCLWPCFLAASPSPRPIFFSFSSLAVVVGRLVNRHDHVGDGYAGAGRISSRPGRQLRAKPGGCRAPGWRTEVGTTESDSVYHVPIWLSSSPSPPAGR